MKFIVTLLFLLSTISVTLGAVSRSMEADPNNPDNCLVRGISFTPGTHKNPSPTQCYRVECHKGGAATVATCGKMSKKNCKSAGYVDVSLPYPECCELKWICTEN